MVTEAEVEVVVEDTAVTRTTPQWEVDADGHRNTMVLFSDVAAIDIFHSQDCCRAYLGGYRILISVDSRRRSRHLAALQASAWHRSFSL